METVYSRVSHRCQCLGRVAACLVTCKKTTHWQLLVRVAPFLICLWEVPVPRQAASVDAVRLPFDSRVLHISVRSLTDRHVCVCVLYACRCPCIPQQQVGLRIEIWSKRKEILDNFDQRKYCGPSSTHPPPELFDPPPHIPLTVQPRIGLFPSVADGAVRITRLGREWRELRDHAGQPLMIYGESAKLA